MARFGKGKPMVMQAAAVLKGYLQLSSRHQAKQALDVRGSRSTGKIHSLRTLEKYTQSVKLAGDWAQRERGLRHLDALTPEVAQSYLAYRLSEGIGQKQLDADRTALSFVLQRHHGTNVLERVRAEAPAPLPSRAYTHEQVQAVAASQSARNRLATLVAHAAGLRAHELLTLKRASEGVAAEHRHWHKDRFEGRGGVIYLVTGKGGLSREVLIPADLASVLEVQRLPEPTAVTDRGIRYLQHYAIGGGNAWSASFTAASKRCLGWSNGAHGLRHSYAQERMNELQGGGAYYHQARNILSQELGHFRGDVVETYLR